MYRIVKSIDVDFSHHVRGHLGPCINLHGHTWKLEVALEAEMLDAQGFVVDFKQLKQGVLSPCHRLLDHALALGDATYDEVRDQLVELGERFLASRRIVHGELQTRGQAPGESDHRSGAAHDAFELHGATNRFPGGMKVAVFPFSPTSERLAEWLYGVAQSSLADSRVRIAYARVYETLHPVHAIAEYQP